MKQPTLTELMALAGVQVVTSPSNGSLLNPKDVGSGFLLHHKGEIFFVTVRHVVNQEKNKKDGELSEDTNKMAIITNGYRFNEKTGLKEGELYSIGGFYTFDLFNVLDEVPEADRVEFAFSIVDKEKLKELKLHTAGVKNYVTGEIIIEAGRSKVILDSSIEVKPNSTDTYYCSGFVQAHWEQAPTGEKMLSYSYIFHNEMKFDRIEGDYIVMKSPEFASKHEWGGLSGSPVINQEGGLVGILKGGKEGTHEIYILSLEKTLQLMDNVLKIETISNLNMANPYELDEIYNEIGGQQANELRLMVEECGEEEAAMKWLEEKVVPELPVTPYDGNIGDGDTNTKPFSKRVKDEIDMLICGHPKYNKEREKILDQYHGWTLYAATAGAAVLGAAFGVSAGIISPAILLLVRCACKVGVNAYCQNVHFNA